MKMSLSLWRGWIWYLTKENAKSWTSLTLQRTRDWNSRKRQTACSKRSTPQSIMKCLHPSKPTWKSQCDCSEVWRKQIKSRWHKQSIFQATCSCSTHKICSTRESSRTRALSLHIRTVQWMTQSWRSSTWLNWHWRRAIWILNTYRTSSLSWDLTKEGFNKFFSIYSAMLQNSKAEASSQYYRQYACTKKNYSLKFRLKTKV